MDGVELGAASAPLWVEVRSVTKTFGAIRALLGVSARFEGGRASVIGGANGSGKSTLLGIIGTLARPTSGSVDHGRLGGDPEAVRAVLGWVGHESHCYADLTGRENLELASRLHGHLPPSAVESARDRFDLRAFDGRPMRTYSRGQRQRVALARALLHAPMLILLDEPSAGLDAGSSERLVRVIREEVARGAVVVIVTHDPGLAAAVGDVRFDLVRGRLVTPPDAP